MSKVINASTCSDDELVGYVSQLERQIAVYITEVSTLERKINEKESRISQLKTEHKEGVAVLNERFSHLDSLSSKHKHLAADYDTACAELQARVDERSGSTYQAFLSRFTPVHTEFSEIYEGIDAQKAKLTKLNNTIEKERKTNTETVDALAVVDEALASDFKAASAMQEKISSLERLYKETSAKAVSFNAYKSELMAVLEEQKESLRILTDGLQINGSIKASLNEEKNQLIRMLCHQDNYIRFGRAIAENYKKQLARYS